MDKKELIILGILAVIAAVAIWFMYFSPVEASSDYSMINIIGDGTIGENGTVYAKLANGENVALRDKEVHITVKDSNGSVVFEDSSKTYVNGVVNFKLTNVSA
jgi:flagellar hook assembly protein FlgD